MNAFTATAALAPTSASACSSTLDAVSTGHFSPDPRAEAKPDDKALYAMALACRSTEEI